MRRLLIFLVLLSLAGLATSQSSWYPEKLQTGKEVMGYGGIYGANYAMVPVLQIIPAAESADADQIANDVSLNSTTKLLINSTGAGSSNFGDDPDVPRCLTVTPADVVTTAIKFTGTDIFGAAITENLTFSASSTAQTTTNAFMNVTKIDATTSGTTRLCDIGTSDKLALSQKLGTYDQVVHAWVNGALEGTAPAVTKNSTVLAGNTIDTATAPGGHATWVYYFIGA